MDSPFLARKSSGNLDSALGGDGAGVDDFLTNGEELTLDHIHSLSVRRSPYASEASLGNPARLPSNPSSVGPSSAISTSSSTNFPALSSTADSFSKPEDAESISGSPSVPRRAGGSSSALRSASSGGSASAGPGPAGGPKPRASVKLPRVAGLAKASPRKDAETGPGPRGLPPSAVRHPPMRSGGSVTTSASARASPRGEAAPQRARSVTAAGGGASASLRASPDRPAPGAARPGWGAGAGAASGASPARPTPRQAGPARSPGPAAAPSRAPGAADSPSRSPRPAAARASDAAGASSPEAGRGTPAALRRDRSAALSAGGSRIGVGLSAAGGGEGGRGGRRAGPLARRGRRSRSRGAGGAGAGDAAEAGGPHD
ncbi:hypothetical protein ACKKBG_A09560 [Auxenochlorella protothecoides x Auxenochlorella symbiontica]